MNIKTKEVLEVYPLLSGAKLTKVKDDKKYQIIKLAYKLKGINDNYQELLKSAQERLKGKNHDEMLKKAQEWQEKGDKAELTEEEKIELNKYFFEYSKKINECMKEDFEKEVELDADKLSSETFESLVASNDWDVATSMKLCAIAE